MTSRILLISCAIVLACPAYAEAFRIRAVDGVFTSWGTCAAISDHEVLTAWHVVEKGEPSVELDGKWEKAALVAKDDKNDLALLKIEKKFDEYLEIMEFPSITLHSSTGVREDKEKNTSAYTTPVTEHRVQLLRLDIAGEVAHANSGGPVTVNGAIVALLTRVEWTGRPEDKPERATCVPSGTILKFLETAGWKRPEDRR